MGRTLFQLACDTTPSVPSSQRRIAAAESRSERRCSTAPAEAKRQRPAAKPECAGGGSAGQVWRPWRRIDEPLVIVAIAPPGDFACR